MFNRILIILCLVCFALVQFVSAKPEGIIVVANTQDDLNLSKQELKRLFMGAYIGYELTAVTLPLDHEARVEFNTSVIGLTEDRIQSYWAQMRFSGRRQAPLQVESEQAIVKHLLSNMGTIAYLPAATIIPEGLKVIYRSKN